MAILNMNYECYKKSIRESEVPVLMEFSAPWCTYCTRLAPVLERFAEEHMGNLVVGQINVDDEPELTAEEKIELVPTLLLYKKGELLGSIVAPESRAQLEEFLSGALEKEKKETNGGPVHIHDMIVVGGGPGGYTTALYAARAGLDTLVLERLSAGGQMALTHQLDNYPGFEEGVDGFELAMKMQQQAERFGAKTVYADVTGVELDGKVKMVKTDGGSFFARTVVISTGANPRELGVAGEKELLGRGVAYCASCDGMFYKGKTVVVVGGGNTAAADALLLSRIAKKVVLVHRRDTLRATKIYHEPLKNAGNVEFRWNSVVEELLSDGKLTGIKIKDVVTGEASVVECDGLFVSVGRQPATEIFKGQVELDPAGYVVADESTRTSIPGVFAVGDVRTKAVRQVVTAVADGATAVHYAEEFLADKM